jgi:hypothetical protein
VSSRATTSSLPVTRSPSSSTTAPGGSVAMRSVSCAGSLPTGGSADAGWVSLPEATDGATGGATGGADGSAAATGTTGAGGATGAGRGAAGAVAGAGCGSSGAAVAIRGPSSESRRAISTAPSAPAMTIKPATIPRSARDRGAAIVGPWRSGGAVSTVSSLSARRPGSGPPGDVSSAGGSTARSGSVTPENVGGPSVSGGALLASAGAGVRCKGPSAVIRPLPSRKAGRQNGSKAVSSSRACGRSAGTCAIARRMMSSSGRGTSRRRSRGRWKSPIVTRYISAL